MALFGAPDGPAFQIIDPLATGDGGYGDSEYGEAPYGGDGEPLFYLPPCQSPGLDPGLRTDLELAVILKKKAGRVVAERVFGSDWARWKLVFRPILHDVGMQFRPYFLARKFYLRPTGSDGLAIVVRWIGTSFRLEPLLGSDRFVLEFEIEEAA